jgi:Spy/CpxP family protein refolding chaperone
MQRITWMLSAVVMAGLFSGVSLSAAEGDAPPAAGGQGGGGNRRQFDPEEFRKRMQERMKENLGVNDDEWKALQPKIDAVQKAQAATRGGGFGRMFGGGGGGGNRNRGGNNPQNAPQAEDPNAPPKSEVEKKHTALQTLADKKDADEKAVKDALKEYRDARDKSKVDLKKAQDELKELLTPRQEAQLVLMGLLE